MTAPAGKSTICLDGRDLALPRGTGVAQYAGALADCLPRAGRGVGVLVDAQPGVARPAWPRMGRAHRWLRAAWPGSCQAVRLTGPIAGIAEAWLARDAFRLAQIHFDIHGSLLAVRGRAPPALMHWTYPLPMTFRGALNVYTIHDMIPIRTPHLTDIDPVRFGRILRAVARAADHIVTVSEASRRDIIADLGVAPSRVTNTYQPPSLSADGQNASRPARRGHFLFCGTMEPRKNLGRLIAAHRACAARRPLILAGPDGWRAAAELAAGGAEIRPLAAMPPDATGGIWRAPWLERPALLDLLRGARALLFPSLAEGFGLPIIEAMTLGVPVLTSVGGATGEIAGTAALLIDPRDTAAIAAGIASLDRDDAMCDRLAANGARRARVFSEAACMARLNAVYDSIRPRA